MKRAFATILAVFYLASSIGATVNLHYCMGEFVSFSLFGEQTGKCGKCGMETHSEDNGCCKNVQVIVEPNEDHLPGQAHQDFTTSFITLIHPVCFSDDALIVKQHSDPEIKTAHSPPFKDRPVFIKIHSLLI